MSLFHEEIMQDVMGIHGASLSADHTLWIGGLMDCTHAVQVSCILFCKRAVYVHLGRELL